MDCLIISTKCEFSVLDFILDKQELKLRPGVPSCNWVPCLRGKVLKAQKITGHDNTSIATSFFLNAWIFYSKYP